MPTMPHRAHVAIDYLSVLIFAVSPTVFGFSGPDAVLCYALAIAHLVVTLTTAPSGAVDVLSNRFHGAIETVVGVALLVGPWLTGGLLSGTGKVYFSAIGAVLLLVGLFTDYTAAEAGVGRVPGA